MTASNGMPVEGGCPHRATAVGALLTMASQLGRLMLSGTEAWARFASWLIG